MAVTWLSFKISMDLFPIFRSNTFVDTTTYVQPQPHSASYMHEGKGLFVPAR